jgi:hypothetical protein
MGHLRSVEIIFHDELKKLTMNDLENYVSRQLYIERCIDFQKMNQSVPFFCPLLEVTFLETVPFQSDTDTILRLYHKEGVQLQEKIRE